MTKKLQIVRVDNDLVQKANLVIGNNIIGRGAATGCNDDRVKHAVTINVSPNDEMTITPYQVAPCYMKSAECARWRSLKLGSSVPIKPGDVCSLLPDKCWFKIISVPDTMLKGDQVLKRKIEQEDSTNEVDGKKTCLLSSMEAAASPGESLNSIFSEKNEIKSNELKDCPVNGSEEHKDATISSEKSDMPVNSRISIDSCIVIEHDNNGKQKTKNINLANKSEANDQEDKKIKQDGDIHFNDQIDAVLPDDLQPPIAACQNQARSSNPDKVPREKCIYGARCYRKNPNHKNNYSHPDDFDYEEVDDREECPYGMKCYRKNPQHKAQFKHTTVPRCRRRAATPAHPVVDISDSSSTEESVDESDYEPPMYTESSDEWDDRSELEDTTG